MRRHLLGRLGRRQILVSVACAATFACSSGTDGVGTAVSGSVSGTSSGSSAGSGQTGASAGSAAGTTSGGTSVTDASVDVGATPAFDASSLGRDSGKDAAGRPADASAAVDAGSAGGTLTDASTAANDSGVPLEPSLLADCTGTSPIVCAIPVPNGNYNVTVELGSPAAAATTRVQAETWRIEAQPATTPAAAFLSETFTVNVRAEEHGTYSAPGGILNLLFDGTAPALHGLGVAAAPSVPTIFVAGDSTVCDWDPSASNAITPPTPSIERGWAQEISPYFNPGIAVANYAVSGQTAGSFYGAYFPPARTAMKAGDYLFIQFGHNDQKTAADIAAYQANLTHYITDARAKNVTPVIFTPVARGTGTDFAGLDQQARDLATAQNVTLIDLTNLAWAYYQTLPDKTVLFVPGQETHFVESGATQIAGIVANALKTSGLGLVPLLR